MRSVYKMCAGHTMLPRSLHFELPENITGDVRCQGGFADVVKYEYGGRQVAVKVLRVTECRLREIMNVSRCVWVSRSLRVLPDPALNNIAELLQGGHRLEKSPASECSTAAWGSYD